MRKLLFLLLLSCSLNSYSQSPTRQDTITYVAGKELYKFHNQISTGYGIELTGATLMVVGAVSKNKNTPMFIAGTVSSIVGVFIVATASDHVGNAGKLLMALSGQPIEIKHRKRKSK